MNSAVLHTRLGDLPVRHGKVRDIYDLGSQLLLVSTDRISAFDWVLPNGIPDKGRVLTQISAFWFELLDTPNHMLSTDLDDVPLAVDVRGRETRAQPDPVDVRGRETRAQPDPVDVRGRETRAQLGEETRAQLGEETRAQLGAETRAQLEGRSMLVRKTHVVPIECVVRGYLAGSGWKEYQVGGEVCGIPLPPGLTECARLPEPIFTPATKEATGHDVNISFERMVEIIGVEKADELRQRSLELYQQGAEFARQKGIIIADTKFEWGQVDGELILIDEVLTPDSSRFWPADEYQPGRSQPSFDKQFVRDWLLATDWDQNSQPPALPDDIVAKTREKYIEAYERLTGQAFSWK